MMEKLRMKTMEQEKARKEIEMLTGGMVDGAVAQHHVETALDLDRKLSLMQIEQTRIQHEKKAQEKHIAHLQEQLDATKSELRAIEKERDEYKAKAHEASKEADEHSLKSNFLAAQVKKERRKSFQLMAEQVCSARLIFSREKCRQLISKAKVAAVVPAKQIT